MKNENLLEKIRLLEEKFDELSKELKKDNSLKYPEIRYVEYFRELIKVRNLDLAEKVGVAIVAVDIILSDMPGYVKERVVEYINEKYIKWGE